MKNNQPSVLLACVNYHAYDELNNYLKSIKNAILNVQGKYTLKVLIADNTEHHVKEIDQSSYDEIDIEIFSYQKNLGYLGAICKMFDEFGDEIIRTFDYVIISNVDLILSENFFTELFNLPSRRSLGWIAPKIFSLSEKKDRNPKMLHRPGLKRIKLLLVMYKYPVLYRLYTNLIYKHRRKKLKNPAHNKIYAGHGSFMIFTSHFMKHHVNFRFPSFLFGEEIFFGELARSSNLDVLYIPDIVVKDIDHASTSKLRRKNYCRMNYESLSKIKSIYY